MQHNGEIILYNYYAFLCVRYHHHVIREIEHKPLRMINSLNSESRPQGKNIGLSLFRLTSFRNVTALDLNFEYCFEKKMKLNQQWKLQMMFSSVHNVHLCMWLISPTPLKIKMSKDQLGFTVWMTGCSLRLSFTSSIASGLAPRSSAVRQTPALSFQQSFHFFFYELSSNLHGTL